MLKKFILKNEKKFIRSLEIMPGLISWNIILFPYWGIFVIPEIVTWNHPAVMCDCNRFLTNTTESYILSWLCLRFNMLNYGLVISWPFQHYTAVNMIEVFGERQYGIVYIVFFRLHGSYNMVLFGLL